MQNSVIIKCTAYSTEALAPLLGAGEPDERQWRVDGSCVRLQGINQSQIGKHEVCSTALFFRYQMIGVFLNI